MGEQQQQKETQASGEGQSEEQQPQGDPATMAKIAGEIALRQYKLETNQAIADQKIRNTEIEARQKRAIADADAAAKIARELPGLQTV